MDKGEKMRIDQDTSKLPFKFSLDDNKWFIAEDAPLHLKTLHRLCENTEYRYVVETTTLKYKVYYIRT